MGPLTRPCLWPEAVQVTWPDFRAMLTELLHEAQTGHLPPDLHTPDGGRVGLGSLLVAAAKAFLALAHHDRLAEVGLQSAPRYPAVAESFADSLRPIEESPFVAPDFSSEKILTYGKLMTWTLKPAYERLPAGPLDETGSYVPQRLVAAE